MQSMAAAAFYNPPMPITSAKYVTLILQYYITEVFHNKNLQAAFYN
jgi:hypothetical protein